MLKLAKSYGAKVRGSQPLKIATAGAASVVVVHAGKGGPTSVLTQ
jgi:hypothetical protein